METRIVPIDDLPDDRLAIACDLLRRMRRSRGYTGVRSQQYREVVTDIQMAGIQLETYEAGRVLNIRLVKRSGGVS